METKHYAWKILQLEDGVIVSDYDRSPWTIGQWRKHADPKMLCDGLNCSPTIIQALSHVGGSVVARVEWKGGSIESADKRTCEYMRIVDAWKWDRAKRAALYADYQSRFEADVLPKLERILA